MRFISLISFLIMPEHWDLLILILVSSFPLVERERPSVDERLRRCRSFSFNESKETNDDTNRIKNAHGN